VQPVILITDEISTISSAQPHRNLVCRLISLNNEHKVSLHTLHNMPASIMSVGAHHSCPSIPVLPIPASNYIPPPLTLAQHFVLCHSGLIIAVAISAIISCSISTPAFFLIPRSHGVLCDLCLEK